MGNSDDSDDSTRSRGAPKAEGATRRRAQPGAPAPVPPSAPPPEAATRRRDAPVATASLDPLAAIGGIQARSPASGHTQLRRELPVDRRLEPGAVIRRRYVLERLIGSGGMGQVWKAKDLVSEQARDPNPFVAIKLLNADFEADPDAFVSLQRETRKAQELAHPNVITVHAFDIDDETGRAFMSMELLEGETLDSVIRRNFAGLPRIEAVPLIAGMAKGLEYAHKKGIVHSDFKPGNVFVTQSGEPKVLDFGIARAAKIAGIERLEDSFDAGTLGGLTPAYASPDMIDQQAPHPADDVYALGLVAYELLTGRHPFDRKDAKQALANGLKPARIRTIRRYEWHAIARALEFDGRKRWQSAGEFLRAFAGRSVAALAASILAFSLAIVAGIFWYQARIASMPSVPFETLPPAVQAEFLSHMANAAGEWRLVQQGNGDESLNAASEYGKAYALHPRNPEATAGLKKSADYILKRLDAVGDRTLRLQELKTVQELSDFYVNYPPLRAAIADVSGGK